MKRPYNLSKKEVVQWYKDNKCEIDENGCWNFTGDLDIGGYGKVKFQGKTHKLHRLSYDVYYEQILPKLNHTTKSFVLHGCHNRRCFNPDCLYLGTHQDNMDDMIECGNSKHSKEWKNKQSDGRRKGKNHKMYGKTHSEETRKLMSENHADFKGGKNPSSKITKEQAYYIKYNPLLHIYGGMKQLAKETGISYRIIQHIKQNHTWTHI